VPGGSVKWIVEKQWRRGFALYKGQPGGIVHRRLRLEQADEKISTQGADIFICQEIVNK